MFYFHVDVTILKNCMLTKEIFLRAFQEGKSDKHWNVKKGIYSEIGHELKVKNKDENLWTSKLFQDPNVLMYKESKYYSTKENITTGRYLFRHSFDHEVLNCVHPLKPNDIATFLNFDQRENLLQMKESVKKDVIKKFTSIDEKITNAIKEVFQVENKKTGEKLDTLDEKVETLGGSLEQKVETLGDNLEQKVETLGGNLEQKVETLGKQVSRKMTIIEEKADQYRERELLARKDSSDRKNELIANYQKTIVELNYRKESSDKKSELITNYQKTIIELSSDKKSESFAVMKEKEKVARKKMKILYLTCAMSLFIVIATLISNFTVVFTHSVAIKELLLHDSETIKSIQHIQTTFTAPPSTNVQATTNVKTKNTFSPTTATTTTVVITNMNTATKTQPPLTTTTTVTSNTTTPTTVSTSPRTTILTMRQTKTVQRTANTTATTNAKTTKTTSPTTAATKAVEIITKNTTTTKPHPPLTTTPTTIPRPNFNSASREPVRFRGRSRFNNRPRPKTQKEGRRLSLFRQRIPLSPSRQRIPPPTPRLVFLEERSTLPPIFLQITPEIIPLTDLVLQRRPPTAPITTLASPAATTITTTTTTITTATNKTTTTSTTTIAKTTTPVSTTTTTTTITRVPTKTTTTLTTTMAKTTTPASTTTPTPTLTPSAHASTAVVETESTTAKIVLKFPTRPGGTSRPFDKRPLTSTDSILQDNVKDLLPPTTPITTIASPELINASEGSGLNMTSEVFLDKRVPDEDLNHATKSITSSAVPSLPMINNEEMFTEKDFEFKNLVLHYNYNTMNHSTYVDEFLQDLSNITLHLTIDPLQNLNKSTTLSSKFEPNHLGRKSCKHLHVVLTNMDANEDQFLLFVESFLIQKQSALTVSLVDFMKYMRKLKRLSDLEKVEYQNWTRSVRAVAYSTASGITIGMIIADFFGCLGK